jgi:type I restriction enzyme, S subunit
MSFPRYPSYKDSGVEWLGDVPKGWVIKRIKHLFEIKKRISGAEGYEVLSITQQGIKVKDIESGDGQLSMDYSKYQFVEIGDFAMNHMDLLTGYVDISPVFGVTSPDYRVFSVRDQEVCFDRYYLYLFQMGYRNKIFYAFGQGSSQLGRWRFPTEQFNSFEFPNPSIQEQKQIAAFLDRETVKIDALIGEQQRLIELLKEKRQSVISHAVTKGLIPNTPMKDSGIEWLGEVPEHWEVKRLKHSLKLLTEKTDRRENPVALENIESWSGRFIQTETTFEGEGIAFERGDILFGKLRPYLAKIYLAETAGEAVGDFHVLRPTIDKDSHFSQYQILNREFIAIIDGSTFGAKMPRVSWDFLGNMILTTPPNSEQQTIAAFLDSETAKLDVLTSEAKTVISLLQERRTALISAAVTGKIDLRNANKPILNEETAYAN